MIAPARWDLPESLIAEVMAKFPNGATRGDLATWLRVHRHTITKEIRRGALKASLRTTARATYYYHIQPHDILDWLDRQSALNIEEGK